VGALIYDSIFDALPMAFKIAKHGYDHSGWQKGLVFDVHSGYVLKFDSLGKVDRAAKGRR